MEIRPEDHVFVAASCHVEERFEICKKKELKVPSSGKTNIAGWNVPIFNRKLSIFNPGPFSFR